jgi:hypothetical protein
MCANVGVKFQRRNATLKIENCEMQLCGNNCEMQLCGNSWHSVLSIKIKRTTTEIALSHNLIVGKRDPSRLYENRTGLLLVKLEAGCCGYFGIGL